MFSHPVGRHPRRGAAEEPGGDAEQAAAHAEQHTDVTEAEGDRDGGENGEPGEDALRNFVAGMMRDA